jgi:ribosome-associated protein
VEQLARGLAEQAWGKKAEQVAILDLRPLTAMTDYFVIATVTSDAQARAVAEHLQQWAAEQMDEHPWHIEGNQGASWLLLDYVDVVVHLFRPEARLYYGLERLWGDAPRQTFRDE